MSGRRINRFTRNSEKKTLWQGGEEHEIAGFSFNSSCNYKEAIGRQFVRVVSCNTTGLCRIIHEIDKEYGVSHVHAVMVRRGSDPGEIKKDRLMLLSSIR